MSLKEVKHWVFDMDGTLTVAVHDFAAIRVALAIPPQDDILTHLAALPAPQSPDLEDVDKVGAEFHRDHGIDRF